MTALETLDNAFSNRGFNPLPVDHEFHSSWDHLPELQTHVDVSHAEKRFRAASDSSVSTQRAVFLCHPSDKPPQQQRYDPFLDVEENHIGIVQVSKNEQYQRGWDVVRFDSPKREETYGSSKQFVVDITYMQPAHLPGTVWPDNWVNRTFVPMPYKRKGSPWSQKSFPLDNVVWSSEPKHDSQGNITWKIPKSVQSMALRAVDRIVAWHAAHPDLDKATELLNQGLGARLQ